MFKSIVKVLTHNTLTITSLFGLLYFLIACGKPPQIQSLLTIPSSTLTVTVNVKDPKETVLPKVLMQTATHLAEIPSSTLLLPTSTVSIIPTTAIIPTHTPASTSTPQPPLKAHTWTAEQVLVQIETGNGDGCCYENNPPGVVLYGDGLFIHTNEIGDYQYEMLGRKLNRHEICAFLNTLDQIGFLDYDHSIYKSPIKGAPSTNIIVNAWKTNSADGELLDRWIIEGSDWWQKECPFKGCHPAPVILPALENAYKFIKSYDPGDLKPLPVNKLILWIIPSKHAVSEPDNPNPWPVKGISLSQLSALAKEEMNFSVVVEDKEIVEGIKQSVRIGFYQQEGQVWYVVFRPYWPSETHFIFEDFLPTPAPVIPPGTILSCNPDDGVVPFP